MSVNWGAELWVRNADGVCWHLRPRVRARACAGVKLPGGGSRPLCHSNTLSCTRVSTLKSRGMWRMTSLVRLYIHDCKLKYRV